MEGTSLIDNNQMPPQFNNQMPPQINQNPPLTTDNF